MTFDAEFFVFVSTVITFVLLFRPVGKSLKVMLDDYADKIAQRIDEARSKRDESKDRLSGAKHQSEDAKTRAEHIVVQAHELAKIRHQERLAQFDRLSARKEQLVAMRLQLAQEEVTKELNELLARKASTFCEHLLIKQYPLVKNDSCSEAAIDKVSAAF